MSYQQFLRSTLPELGYNWQRFRTRRIRRRLAAAMRASGACTWDSFAELLRHDQRRRAALRECLSVTISRFWRNPAVFRALHDSVFPDILGGLAPGEPLLAWSAGTASGQEAYSLALLYALLPTAVTYGHPLRILGTDINRIALARGLADRWTESELADLPPRVACQWFRRRGAFSLLHRSVRSAVILVQSCLCSPPPVRTVHLAMCRNSIMTYLRGEAREAAMAHVVATLSEGGWLILGRTEHMPKRWAARWGLVHTGRQIYRVRGITTAPSPPRIRS